MKEITFEIIQADGVYVARWDDPSKLGGITTQAASIKELVANIVEAVQCHFDDDELPVKVLGHFVTDPVLIPQAA